MARAREKENNGRFPRQGSGEPLWLTPPLELRLDPLDLSPQPLTWQTWLTGRHGSPLRLRNGWHCHAHFFRDDRSLSLLLSFAAKVNWLHPLTRLILWLDVQRDMRTCLQTSLQPGKCSVNKRVEVCRGELPWDHFRTEQPSKHAPIVRQSLRAGRWFVGFKYPFRRFPALRARANVGLNFQAQACAARQHIEMAALAADGQRFDCPWAFPDLVLNDSPFRVRSIRFVELNYDANLFEVAIVNRSARAVSGTLKTLVRAERYRAETAQPFRVRARATRRVTLYFRPSPRAYRHQVLAIEVRDPSQAAWRCAIRIGNGISPNQGGHVLQLHHVAPVAATAGEFGHTGKRLAILSRLPRCRRLPSVVLATQRIVSADGAIAVDLRRPDALRRLAIAVARIFPEETERLAAFTYFVHQNVVYSARTTPISDTLCPRERFQLGAGICSAFVLILKELLEHLADPRTGKPYCAGYWNTGSRHVVLAVWLGRKKVLLDPTLGVVHFAPRGNGFASADQLAGNPGLVERTILGRNDDYLYPSRGYGIEHGT
jgi:hypothetical protein